MVESAATDETREERVQCEITDQLVEVRKRKDEEVDARCLMEEMQHNLDTAQNKSCDAERKPCSVLWECIEASDQEGGRPKDYHYKTLAARAELGHQKFEYGQRSGGDPF